MAENNYPVEGIHIPPKVEAVNLFQGISKLGGAILILIGSFVTLAYLINTFGFRINVSSLLLNLPLGAGLVFGNIPLFLQKKALDQNQRHYKILSVALGLATLAIGITIIATSGIYLTNNPIFTANNIIALSFILCGSSIIVSNSQVPHRYHFSQILVISILVFTTFKLIDTIYRLALFYSPTAQMVEFFCLSAILIIYSQSILFTKPDRGFLGIFTSDSPSGVFAQRLLFYIIFLPSFEGLIIILGNLVKLYDIYTMMSITVVTFMFTYIGIAWINAKSLYRSEQERLVMREALRINNIHLELSKENLSNKVVELQKEKEQVSSKINNMESLKDIVDST